MTLCSCSGSRINKAEAKGVTDALALIETVNNPKSSELQKESAILEIRNNERILRLAGENKAADKYFDSFKNTLQNKDITLYKTIFQE